jgi:hypothetical protein
LFCCPTITSCLLFFIFIFTIATIMLVFGNLILLSFCIVHFILAFVCDWISPPTIILFHSILDFRKICVHFTFFLVVFGSSCLLCKTTLWWILQFCFKVCLSSLHFVLANVSSMSFFFFTIFPSCLSFHVYVCIFSSCIIIVVIMVENLYWSIFWFRLNNDGCSSFFPFDELNCAIGWLDARNIY